MKKDIGKFKVSMHGIYLMQPFEPIQYLFQEKNSLALTCLLVPHQKLLKVPSIAELSHNKKKFPSLKRLNKANDIHILTALQNSNFSSN